MLQKFSDLPAFRHDPLALMLARGGTAQPLARVNVGFNPTYLLTDPALIRKVLNADEQSIDKGRLIYKLREVLGTSSLTISGPAHRARRGVIHKTMLEGLAGPYVLQIGAVVRAWAAKLAKEQVIDAHGATSHLALRIISAILFGSGALSPGDDTALVEAVHLAEDDLAEDLFRALPHTPWAYVRKKHRLREARKIMGLVVERTRKNASTSSLVAALESLGLKGDVLRDEVLLMLLAGHHTSGTAAAWILYHLAADPDLARRMAVEAAKLSDANGELTPLAIRSASLSRAYVHEILRLYPSTYWMSRELRHDQDVAGVQLRRGTSLLISQWHLHRDPRFWTEPEKLDLTRSWTPNPAYMPFGFGGRACVAMNVALIELQMVALEFALAFEAAPAAAAPPGLPRPSITLVPPPIQLRIRTRQNAPAPHPTFA